MRHHIEHAKIKYDRVTVTGWLVGDTLHSETQLWVEDGRGHRIPCQVDRTLRDDVAVAIWGAENAMPLLESWQASVTGQDHTAVCPAGLLCGFRIRFEAKDNGRYVICLSDGTKTIRCKTDAAQIRQLGRIPDDFKEIVKIKLKGVETTQPLRRTQRAHDLTHGQYFDVKDPAVQTVKFSFVIPAYNTEPEHLADMLDSIWQQSYGNWEICMADGSPESMLGRFQTVAAGQADPGGKTDEKAVLPTLTVKLAQTLVKYLTDPRMKYVHLDNNLGISGNTNAAFALAEGEYVVMVDHDDVLEDDALEMVFDVIRKHPQADFIYTNSDLTDHDNLYNYNHLLKPRWSQEMLYSANYITHLSVVRTSLLQRIGGWKAEYDGAQDWDLFLRIGEVTKEIYHIPEELYHWRAAETSTARDVGTKPYAKLAQLKSVQDHLDRRGLPATTAFVDEHSTCIRVMWKPEYLASLNKDDVLIFATEGVQLSEESAAELRAWALQPGMGVIGPRVLGLDGKILSQGAQLEITPNMPMAGMTPGTASFGGHTDWYQDHVAPEPVCYAISRSLWEELGGLDESQGLLDVIDLCLRAQKAGYRCMVTPFAQIVSAEKTLQEKMGQEFFPTYLNLYKKYYPRVEDRPN